MLFESKTETKKINYDIALLYCKDPALKKCYDDLNRIGHVHIYVTELPKGILEIIMQTYRLTETQAKQLDDTYAKEYCRRDWFGESSVGKAAKAFIIDANGNVLSTNKETVYN